MTLIFSILKWTIGGIFPGFNLLAIFVAGLIGTGIGFLNGYGSAADAAKIKNLQAQLRFANNQLAIHRVLGTLAAKQATEAATDETYNDAVQRKLSDASPAPAIDGCFDGDFLDGLRKLR